MKFLAFVLIVYAIHNVEAEICTGQNFQKILGVCLSKHKGEQNDIADLLNHKNAANDNAKCFRACLLQDCKVMDGNGDFILDTYKEYLQVLSLGDAEKQNVIAGQLESCLKSTLVKGEPCISAEEYIKCIFENCKTCNWDFIRNEKN